MRVRVRDLAVFDRNVEVDTDDDALVPDSTSSMVLNDGKPSGSPDLLANEALGPVIF